MKRSLLIILLAVSGCTKRPQSEADYGIAELCAAIRTYVHDVGASPQPLKIMWDQMGIPDCVP